MVIIHGEKCVPYTVYTCPKCSQRSLVAIPTRNESDAILCCPWCEEEQDVSTAIANHDIIPSRIDKVVKVGDF